MFVALSFPCTFLSLFSDAGLTGNEQAPGEKNCGARLSFFFHFPYSCFGIERYGFIA